MLPSQHLEDIVTFHNVCKQNGLVLLDKQLNIFEKYVRLLLDWNNRINLISHKDEANIWTKHILHSISILFKIELPKKSRIIDIGTGGGLPGIPIKIVRPDLTFLLLDATRKKTEAIMDIVRNLGIEGVEIKWGRAEEIGLHTEYNARFDFAFARAVAPLPLLVKWAKPFLYNKFREKDERINDRIWPMAPALIALKGGDLSEEIRKVRKKYRSLTVRELSIGNSVLNNDLKKKIVVVEYQN